VVGTDDARRAHPYRSAVHREQALEQLPAAYAIAIRLRDSGAPEDVIARGLGTEPEAVATLLDIADRKLAALVARDEGLRE
jgi:hypothetical protein